MKFQTSSAVALLATAFLTHAASASSLEESSSSNPVTPDSVLVIEPVTGVLAESDLLPAVDAQTVDQIMSAAGFQLASVREGDSVVPRLYPTAMPGDMADIDQAAEKKRIFITVMLPLVLAANENIAADRVVVLDLKARMDAGETLSREDRTWLEELGALYYVEDGNLDNLVARVDVVPPSLVLAQAALESGWGTSRFAHEGNAVFGQRSWDEDDGIVPEARGSGETHVVKSFDGLKDSVLAYLVNLNRHPAYRHLRQIRTALHSENLPLDGWTLAAGLDDYAEEPDYIKLVRSVIRFNKLTDFDNARLADLSQ